MPQQHQWTYRLAFITAVVVAIISCFYLYRSLERSIGVTPDSAEYIYAAQTYKQREGLRSVLGGDTGQAWLTHFPPGLPVLYGTLAQSATVSGIAGAAATCNILFFALNGILVYLLAYAGSRNKWLALLAGLFMFSSTDGISISEMLWSEPPFMFFALLSLYALSRHADSGSMQSLLAAAVLVALACTVRYVGITLIITGSLIVMGRKNQRLLQKSWRLLCFGLISSSLLLLWFARNYRLQDTMSDRRLDFHPMTPDYLHDFLHSIKSFCLQINTGEATACIGGLITLGLLYMLYRSCWQERALLKAHSLPRILLLYGIVYFLFLFVSNTFLDFTPLYYRIVYLPFLCFLLAFVMRAPYSAHASLASSRRKIILATLLGLLVLQHLVSFRNFLSAGQEPEGLLSARWQHSETVAALRQLPANAVLYSTDPDAVYVAGSRLSGSMDYIDKSYAAHKAQRQFIIYFKEGRISNGYSYNDPFPDPSKFNKIVLLKDCADGKIYEVY